MNNKITENLIKEISLKFLLENHFMKGGPCTFSVPFSRCFPANTNLTENEITFSKVQLRDALEDFIKVLNITDIEIADLAEACANNISGGREYIGSFELRMPSENVKIEYSEEENYNEDNEEWETKFIPEKVEITVENKNYDITNRFEDEYLSYNSLISDAEVITGISKDKFSII